MLTRAPKPVLIVTTSHAILGDTGRPTGVWLEEVAAPYWAFRDAGLEVVIASPAGGEIPVDPASLLPDFLTSEAQRFRQDRAAQALMAGSTQLGTTPQEFAAILFAGGHGTMWDFPGNGEIASLLTGAFDKAVPVGAVCHGVAGLLASPSLAKGKRLTGFSNAEENAAGLDAVVPFLLETSLLDAGATYSAGPAFAPYTVVDGILVTGQNPASSTAVAAALLSAMAAAP